MRARSRTGAFMACTCPMAAAWASSTRRWSTRPAPARRSCSARPPGESRRSPAIWSDDGIVVHLPDAEEPPPADLVLLEPDEIEDLVVRELGSSALFGARFRENAARALLIPRAYPGKRTPLWQQRLKAQSLLEVAKDFPRFP